MLGDRPLRARAVPMIGSIHLSMRRHNNTQIFADWAEFDGLVHPEETTSYIIDDLI
jgi:hypothetical protein